MIKQKFITELIEPLHAQTEEILQKLSTREQQLADAGNLARQLEEKQKVLQEQMKSVDIIF